MKVQVITKITTLIDVETMTPEHSVSIEPDSEVPGNIALMAALGACRAAANSLEAKQPVSYVEEEGDDS